MKILRALGLSIVVVAMSTVGVVAAATPATSPYQVSETSTSAPGLGMVSCPTTAVCFATGDAIGGASSFYASTDGGTTWTQQPTLQGFGLLGLSCPTTTVCFATGGSLTTSGGPLGLGAINEVFETSDAGTTWTNVSTGLSWLNANTIGGKIKCLSATMCYVPIGLKNTGQVAITTNAGTTWTLASPGLFASSLSCPTTTTCYAAGQVSSSSSTAAMSETTNDGTTWTPITLPNPTAIQIEPYGVACPSTTTCFVGLETFGSGALTDITTTNGGATWTTQTAAGGGQWRFLVCPSTTNCYAAVEQGSLGEAVSTSDGGTTWQKTTIPGLIFDLGITCPTATVCTFSNSIFSGGTSNYSIYLSMAPLHTTDGGTTWTQQSFPQGADQWTSVTCPTATTCYAVGIEWSSGSPTVQNASILATTTNGGATWTTQVLPVASGTAGGFPTSIACPSTTTCYVVGLGWATAQYQSDSSGMVYVTTDGGATWTSQSLSIAGVAHWGLLTIACPSATACYAGGGGGGTGAIFATTNGGATWTQQSVSSNGIAAIACPTTSTCYAAGAYGLVGSTADAGATWSSTSTPPGIDEIMSLDCPTASTCYVGGEMLSSGSNTTEPATAVTTNSGTSWTVASVPAAPSGMSGVVQSLSCTSASTCLAVGIIGPTPSSGGTASVRPAVVSPNAVPVLPSQSIKATPYVVQTTDGGTTWSAQTMPAGTGGLNGADCTSGSCTLVGMGAFGSNYGGMILTPYVPPCSPTVAITSGANQSAQVNTKFADSINITATCANGTPDANAPVTITLPTTGATGSYPGGPPTVTTTSTGTATVPPPTAGPTTGSWTFTVGVPGGSTSTTFTNTPVPASCSPTVAITSGASQSAQVNTKFADSIDITATCANGTPDANAPVTVTFPTTGATGSYPGGAPTVTTTSTGTATIPPPTAGPTAGTWTFTVGVPGGSTSTTFTNTTASTVPSTAQPLGPSGLINTGGGKSRPFSPILPTGAVIAVLVLVAAAVRRLVVRHSR